MAVGILDHFALDIQTRLYPPIPLYQCTDLAHYAPSPPPVLRRHPLPGGLAGAPHRLGTHSKATRDVVKKLEGQ